MTQLLRAIAICVLLPVATAAQGLTGALIGTVKDVQGGVLPGARVRLASPALIGGPITVISDEKGQLRFPTLPPGPYGLDVELEGFAGYHEDDIRIGAGATIERTAILSVAGLAESVVVEGAGSRIDARDPGFGTRFGRDDLETIPTRRSSMFDAIRAAPGVSPTSPSSGSGGGGTATTVSAFGSGTNENQFLIDGTNTTCPCNGVARSEAGVDFIQEVQLQSLGASAEFGNVQGAVINIVLKQGSERFLFDAAYYAQAAGLTSQPVLLRPLPPKTGQSGYERAKYRDLATTLGGPVVQDRLWFFTGYQYLRDYDSQPGADPAFPRTYEQNKLFAKLTWRFSPAWQLMQSVHDQIGVNPDRPTLVTPYDAITRPRVSAPAMTFGHLTHAGSANTLWDARVGRFVFSQNDESSTGSFTTPSRQDRVTRVISGAPANFGELTIIRNTAKATLTHYRRDLVGIDHQWKIGGQFERGEHHVTSNIPTGVRFVDNGGQPFQAITSPPSNTGGVSLSASGFVTDTMSIGNRLTLNAGVRYDNIRAVSQDLHTLDAQGRETSDIIRGLGTLYTWNLFSPRLGATARLTPDGRTILRASYGWFSQGVLTGDIGPFHPGASAVTTTGLVPGAPSSVVDPRVNLRLDPDTRAPHTDEYGVGVDREVGGGLAVAIAYVGKRGGNFIGWTDVGGQYIADTRTLSDRTVPVSVLVNPPGPSARRFLLTNPDRYSMTYNGLVVAAEKRRAHGWQAFGSYTFSRTYGLQVSSGTTAGGPQVSTVAPPNPSIFGRDPNDLLNARGRLPNDRPHMFRIMTSVDVPRTGLLLAANLQCFSGKPWAATTQIALPQGDQRVLLEPRGSRRLSSQTLLDLRAWRSISFHGVGRVDLILDVLNALNDTAEEELASDNLFSPTFGQPTVFIDPRRAMISARFNLGR